MRTVHYQFPASRSPARRAHVGVVGSGDLEVLLEPGTADGNGGASSHAQVRVRTSVEGFDEVLQATLERFFARTPVLGDWELNDAATCSAGSLAAAGSATPPWPATTTPIPGCAA